MAVAVSRLRFLIFGGYWLDHPRYDETVIKYVRPDTAEAYEILTKWREAFAARARFCIHLDPALRRLNNDLESLGFASPRKAL